MSGTIDGSMVAIPRMPIPRKHSFETLQTYQGLQQAICIDRHLAGDHNILGVGVATGGSAFAKYTELAFYPSSSDKNSSADMVPILICIGRDLCVTEPLAGRGRRE